MVKTVSPRKVAKAIASKRNAVAVAFAANLKRIRIKRDLSQQELAFACEIDRTYVSLMERGLANPSLLTIATICHVLEITLSELLAGITETMAPSGATATGTKRRKNQASHELKPKGSRRSPLR